MSTRTRGSQGLKAAEPGRALNVDTSSAEGKTASDSSAQGTSRPEPVPADSAAEVLKQFRIIFRSVKKHFLVIERTCGIGGSQLWALATVAQTPGIRVSGLAKALSIHQSTASNLVDQMVKLGLLIRERDEEDQRVVHLKASEKGLALIALAPQPLTGVLTDALAQLDPSEVHALRQSLARLLDVMALRDDGAILKPLA